MSEAFSDQIIGEATDYQSLIDVLRARAEELQITRLEIDELAGLAPGYSGKTLGPAQKRHLDRYSTWRTLEALGLKMLLVDDPEKRAMAEAHIGRKWPTAGRPWTERQFAERAERLGVDAPITT